LNDNLATKQQNERNFDKSARNKTAKGIEQNEFLKDLEAKYFQRNEHEQPCPED
jgi:hypothetical protein